MALGAWLDVRGLSKLLHSANVSNARDVPIIVIGTMGRRMSKEGPQTP